MARSTPKTILNSSTNLLKRTPKGKRFLRLLTEGCNMSCTYDEAEGELYCHCLKCQQKITELAYELFILGRHG